MRDKIWYMMLVLGLVASIAGASLSFVYSKTAPVIEQQILTEKIKPSLDVFFKEVGATNDYIADNVNLDLGTDDWGRKKSAKAFVAKAGQKMTAVAIQTSAGGFGGDISVLTAFEPSDGRIIGVRALDQKETAGLGARVADPSEPFIGQFVGMPCDAPIQLSADGGKVDAISGATISSRGFTAAVEQARILMGEKMADITAPKETP